MVSLITLKVGDTIKFRDGMEAVFVSTELICDGDYEFLYVCYEENGEEHSDTYKFDGKKFACPEENPKDIVEIIPKEQPKSDDAVNHPSHYTSGGIECIAAIKASMSAEEYRGYLKGNVMKYLWRYESKGKPAEDLKKARVYLDWLIKEIEE